MLIAINNLLKRKQELENIIQKRGMIEDGKNLYFNPNLYNERLELSLLDKFEREVCELDKVSDPVVFFEWTKKNNRSWNEKIIAKFLK